MMIVGGVINALYGLFVLVKDTWPGWKNGDVWIINLTTWGWVHLLIGLVVALCGVGVLSGNVLARSVGVILAALSIVTNFMFLTMQPWWAITVIVIDLLVMWALTVHGHEMRTG